MTGPEIDAAAERVAAEAPPLTAGQVDRLRALLGTTSPVLKPRPADELAAVA